MGSTLPVFPLTTLFSDCTGFLAGPWALTLALSSGWDNHPSGNHVANFLSSFTLVMVNFTIVNLTGLRGAQIAGKALLLDVSVRVSSEEISIWVRSISKDHCQQYGWVSSKLLRSWIEQKGRERRNLLSLLELLYLPPPALKHKHSWFPGLWTQKWT